MKNITILAALLGLGCTSETMMIPEDIIGEAGATTEVPETGGTEATGGSGTGGNEPTGGNVETGGTDPTGGNEATGGNVATGGDQTGGTATGGNGTGGTEDPFAIFQESESNPNGIPFTCNIFYSPYGIENNLMYPSVSHSCWNGGQAEWNIEMAALYCKNENYYPKEEELSSTGSIFFSAVGFTETLKCSYWEMLGVTKVNGWCCFEIDKFIN